MLRAFPQLRTRGSLTQAKGLLSLGGQRGMADGEEHASASDLEKKLKEKLGATQLEVMDTSGGCGASFTVCVVSPQFEGKSLLTRHRMINIALQQEMQFIHALSIRKVQSQTEFDKSPGFDV